MSGQLKDLFIVMDKDRGDTVYDIGIHPTNSKVILQCSVHIVKTIKTLKRFFNTTVVVIQETPETIAARLIGRGGVYKERTIERRSKRMASIVKNYSNFIGTADACLVHLRSLGTT